MAAVGASGRGRRATGTGQGPKSSSSRGGSGTAPKRATKAAPAKTAAKSTAKTAAKSTAKTAAKTAVTTAPAKKSSTASAAQSAPSASSTRTASKSAPKKAAAAKSAAPKSAAPKSAAPKSAAPKKASATPPVPKGSEWTPAELREIRAQLIDELNQMTLAYDRSLSELSDLQRASTDGAGDDQADAGNKTFEREQEQSIAANRFDLLVQIRRAVERIDAGTYGYCESCGKPIPKARLQAFPSATLDVACKQREERR